MHGFRVLTADHAVRCWRRFVVCAGIVLGLTSGHAAGQDAMGQGAVRIPPGAVLWWTCDPTALGATDAPAGALPDELESRFATCLLRAAVSSRLIEDQSAATALRILLAASDSLALPHTLCVLGLRDAAATDGNAADHRPESKRAAARHDDAWTTSLEVVLDLTAGSAETQRRLVRTLEAVLIGGAGEDGAEPGNGNDAAASGSSQRVLSLPNGRTGVAFRRARWPAGFEVAWCSSAERFTIAIGGGVLERWTAAQDRAPEPVRADLASQQATIARARAGTRRLLEFGLDCTELRSGLSGEAGAAPTRSLEGRVARLLREWKLANARSFMLHASVVAPADVRTAFRIGHAAALPSADADRPDTKYAGPPLVVLDATWSARSEPLDSIGHLALSEAYWPTAELGAPPRPLEGGARDADHPGSSPPRTAFVAVFMADVERLLEVGTGLYAGTLDRPHAAEFDRDRQTWRHASAGARARQARRLTGRALLIGPSSRRGFVCSDIAIVADLHEDADPAAFERDVAALLAPLREHTRRADESGLWVLNAPHLGLIDLAAWKFAPRTSHRGGGIIGVLGIGLTPARAADRVNELSRWWADGRK